VATADSTRAVATFGAIWSRIYSWLIEEFSLESWHPTLSGLTPGRIIQLRSLATGKTVRICDDGRVDAMGAGGIPIASILPFYRDWLEVSQTQWLYLNDWSHAVVVGRFAQFIVSPNNGFIRFQNVQNPNVYLAIRNGQVTFGEGFGHCEFFVSTISPDVITLKAAHEAGMPSCRSSFSYLVMLPLLC
jgi:hypothetical protein